MSENNGKRASFKRSNKGGRGQRRERYPSKQKDAEREASAGTICVGSNRNDLAWYSKSPSVLRDASALSFNNPLGTTYTLNNSHVTVSYSATGSETVPGICAMGVVPGIGLSTEAQSAVNIAAKSIYSFVRHMNSGHANYDSPDLMQYLLAVDSLYYMYTYAKRAYAACFTVSQRNRFLPKNIVEAMGWDFTDLNSHLADFRGYLNTCVIRMKALCVPNTMPLHQRHAWLFSGAFVDSEDATKSQMYLYYPQGYYTYDTSVTPAKLKWNWLFTPHANVSASGYRLTVSAFEAIFESILAPLVGSEDIGIMSGDILKAYGAGNMYVVPETQPAEPFLVAHDEMVLRQIQNANIPFLDYVTSGDMDITQDATIGSPTEGCILYNPHISQSNASSIPPAAYWRASNKVLNAGTIEPDPGYVAEITRLAAIVEPRLNSGATAYDFYFISLGSEFIDEMRLYYIGPNGTMYNYDVWMTRATESSANGFVTTMAPYTALTAFDFHPELLVWYTAGSSSALFKMFDYENYTVATPETLEKINRACIFSLFGLPL